MTTVQYRQLGKCGLKVSVPILGAMSFGSSKWAPWVLDEDKALPLLKTAWDRGINTFDTANVYSNGASEQVLGKFMVEYNIPRSEIVVLTKCNGLVENTIAPMSGNNIEARKQREYINQYGLSRSAIFNAVDASLKRLNTHYVDLLQIHRFDKYTPVEETMKALHDLIQDGKVRYIGASSMRTWQFALMNEVAEKHGWTKFVSMQCEYSLLYREEEREMLPYCEYHGIGVIPWGPLSFGQLSRPPGTETARTESMKAIGWEQKANNADEAIIARVDELGKKHGRTMAQIALAWASSKIASPIVGTTSEKRLSENIVDENFVLLSEESAYLEEPYIPKAVRGHA